MKPFSFVHAADLHLDSPFTGITAQSDQIGNILFTATFKAFENLLDLCIEKRVDLLLISGDVYDSADRSLRAQLRFSDGLARLAAVGIHVFVVHGNHDPLDGWSTSIDWPDGIHIFGGTEVESIVVQKDGRPVATIHGISYTHQDERRNLAKQFKKNDNRLFHIGLLHCNAGNNKEHAPYAPCDLQDLMDAGMDYWALGHVHKKCILSETPCIVYSGNTQGRSIRETGERGCYLVTVDSNGQPRPEFRPIDAARWYVRRISIDGLSTINELDMALSDTCRSMREDSNGLPVFARIILYGRGRLYDALRVSGAIHELTERLREQELSESPIVWIEKIVNTCRPDIDIEKRKNIPDLLGDLLRISAEIRNAPNLPDTLTEPLKAFYTHPKGRKFLAPLDAETLRHLLDDAERFCVDRLGESV
jgi:DNA repair exonuclease SbcCD nuclease subunit